jgi:cytochrome d ubiquinol oxidase subunit II
VVNGAYSGSPFGSISWFSVLVAATLRPISSNDTVPLAGLTTATVALIIAVVVARYPILIPPALTLDDAVSPPNTMVFLAVGIGLNVPLLFFYNWFAHHAFRGKLISANENRDAPDAEVGAIP